MTLELRNIIWAQPIVVDSHQPVSIALIANANAPISFEIYSNGTNAEKFEEVIHCQGQAAFINRNASIGDVLSTKDSTLTKLDILLLKGQMKYGKLDLDSRKENSSFLGEPVSQGITALYKGDNQLLVELSLPITLADNTNEYSLHPVMMNGVVQACLGLLDDVNQTSRYVTLPFAMESLQIVSQCTEKMVAWIRYSHGNQSEKHSTVKLDINLCDQDGALCVFIQGLSFEKQMPESLRGGGISDHVADEL
jgi:hypothetical protein